MSCHITFSKVVKSLRLWFEYILRLYEGCVEVNIYFAHLYPKIVKMSQIVKHRNVFWVRHLKILGWGYLVLFWLHVIQIERGMKLWLWNIKIITDYMLNYLKGSKRTCWKYLPWVFVKLKNFVSVLPFPQV